MNDLSIDRGGGPIGVLGRALVVATLAMALVGALFYARAQDAALLAQVRAAVFDGFAQQNDFDDRAADAVAVIDIDDASIRRLGRWPWPRDALAELLTAAAGAGAAAVALDIVLPEPDRHGPEALAAYFRRVEPGLAPVANALPDPDQALADALAAVPTALAMAAVADEGADSPPPPGRFAVAAATSVVDMPRFGGLLRSLPRFEAVAAGAGIANSFPDDDGVVRQMPLVFQVGETLYPSLALEAVRIRRGAGALLLQPTARRHIAAVGIDDLEIPTDGAGRVWAPLARFDIPRTPAYAVLANGALPQAFTDKVVFVGVSASGVAPEVPIGDGKRAPSHHLQAAATAALLIGAAGYRPDYILFAEAAAATLACIVFLGFAVAGRRNLALAALLLAPIGIYHYAQYRFRVDNLLFDPTLTAAALAVVALTWGVYLLVAQRVALFHERSFIGRTVSLMSEGLIVTDRSGGIVSANAAAAEMVGRLPPLRREGDAEDIAPASLLVEDDGEALEVRSAWIADRGRTLGVHLVRDVTKLKQAEDAALRASQRLASATESMPDGLALFGADGRIVFHNPALRTVTGLPERDDLIGCSYATFMAAAFAERPPAFSERLARSREERQLEDERQTRLGAWILARERPTSDGGLVAVFTDITAIKRAEADLRQARQAAEAANEAKNRFLATISHELRTPLNAILGFADAIDQGMFGPLENARYREYVRYIMGSGSELLDLVENLLDVASAEAAEFRIDLNPLDVGELIAGMALTFEPQAQKAGIRIEVDAASDMPPCRLDLRAIGRILSNLISNSLKYGRQDGRVLLRGRYGPGIGHIIEVEDDGIGMSDAQIVRAFEPFWQAGGRSEGMGLGLPLVKTLVERQGGQIAIESAIDRGTIVSLRFPEAGPGR